MGSLTGLSSALPPISLSRKSISRVSRRPQLLEQLNVYRAVLVTSNSIRAALKLQHHGRLRQHMKEFRRHLVPTDPRWMSWSHSGGTLEAQGVKQELMGDRRDLGSSFCHWKCHAHYAKQSRARNGPKSHYVADRECSHFLRAL